MGPKLRFKVVRMSEGEMAPKNSATFNIRAGRRLDGLSPEEATAKNVLRAIETYQVGYDTYEAWAAEETTEDPYELSCDALCRGL